MTADAIIEVVGVSKSFGESEQRVIALDQVSAEIRRNEFFTLLGPSGCGKTTLLRLIAGFELPDSGEIRLDGAEIGHLPPNKRPVNTVFQSYALFPLPKANCNCSTGVTIPARNCWQSLKPKPASRSRCRITTPTTRLWPRSKQAAAATTLSSHRPTMCRSGSRKALFKN